MPVLTEMGDRPTLEVTLPQSSGKVLIYEWISSNERRKIDDVMLRRFKRPQMTVGPEGTQADDSSVTMELDQTAMAQIDDVLVDVWVASWDFEDKNGTELKPTVKNIRSLPDADFEHLVAQIRERDEEGAVTPAKKAVSSKSS